MGERDGEERFLNMDGVGDDLFRAIGDGSGELDAMVVVLKEEAVVVVAVVS